MFRYLAPFLLAVLLFGCSDDDEPEPQGTPGATMPFPTTQPGATPRPGEPAPTPAPGIVPAARRLTGVFSERQDPVITGGLALAEQPATPFKAWDGGSVVLYDTETGQERDFGPGSVWSPSFGGGYFVYTREGEVWLVNLQTMRRESLGRGLVAYFLGDKHVVINPGDNMFVAVHVETRVKTPLGQLTSPLLRSMADERWGGQFIAKWIDGRYAIRNVENPAPACPEQPAERRVCEAGLSELWIVEDVHTDEVLYSFVANKVEPAGPGEFVIATSPLCDDGGRVASCYELLERLDAQSPNAPPATFVNGWTNIFLVNIETGAAEFVASATYNAGAGAWPMSWPLAADQNYVVWTESYCGEPRGLTRVLLRGTGEIMELDQAQWVTLRNGRLGIGEFGAKALLDPATLEYLAVLPELADVSWSPDFRYAAVGQAFGHGGVCGRP